MLKEKSKVVPLKIPSFTAFVTVVGRLAEGGKADGMDTGEEVGKGSAMVPEASQMVEKVCFS
jgi:hypothetical protein